MNILNSRSEFNRCYIPRLVVEQEDEGAKKDREEEEAKELQELLKNMEHDDMTPSKGSWEQEMYQRGKGVDWYDGWN